MLLYMSRKIEGVEVTSLSSRAFEEIIHGQEQGAFAWEQNLMHCADPQVNTGGGVPTVQNGDCHMCSK